MEVIFTIYFRPKHVFKLFCVELAIASNLQCPFPTMSISCDIHFKFHATSISCNVHFTQRPISRNASFMKLYSLTSLTSVYVCVKSWDGKLSTLQLSKWSSCGHGNCPPQAKFLKMPCFSEKYALFLPCFCPVFLLKALPFFLFWNFGHYVLHTAPPP